MADAAGRRHAVPAHEVFVRLLLHLPREADPGGAVEVRIALDEAERLASTLAAATNPYAAWQAPPLTGVPNVSDIDLSLVDDHTARVVLERFHYLESFRLGSEHLGGTLLDGAEERLVAMLTVSPLDVPTIAEHLPPDIEPQDVAVLARVFAFDWAPRNTLSFLMARAARRLRRRSRPPRMLITYLNPNVGFTGASYRAANWSLWAREVGTRYAYVDGLYVTDRELARRFGSAEPESLAREHAGKVVFSRMPLRPLELYAYALDRRVRDVVSDDDPIELPRPSA